MELVRLDLGRGVATPRTLERASRAARFGGGADAVELLSRVHAQLGEAELAEQSAARARSLREAQTAKAEPNAPGGEKENFPPSE
jgi:hypothetical protein